MKKLLFLLTLSACGFASVGNESIGQVKKVKSVTPIACSDYTEVDISLGVMVNGVGSMSHEDKEFLVTNQNDIAVLKEANASGKLVKFTYDDARVRFCVPDDNITRVEILK